MTINFPKVPETKLCLIRIRFGVSEVDTVCFFSHTTDSTLPPGSQIKPQHEGFFNTVPIVER